MLGSICLEYLRLARVGWKHRSSPTTLNIRVVGIGNDHQNDDWTNLFFCHTYVYIYNNDNNNNNDENNSNNDKKKIKKKML